MIHIDEIGILYEALPPDAPDGAQPAAQPGWHVNTTHAVNGWDAYRVAPTTPRRVFGGVATVFYTWPDKHSFDIALATADLSLPPPVPEHVPVLQALLAIDAAGLSAAYQAWAANPARTFAQRAFIERAQNWHRSDATLIEAAADMGLSSDDLDNLFRLAAELLK